MGAEDHQSLGEKCRDCGSDVSAAISAGEPKCPNCGCYFRTLAGEGMSRGGLWLLFFVIFLGTPVLTFVSAQSGFIFPVFLTGTFVAGGILSRLFTKDMGARFIMTIVFGLLLLVVYVGIAFAGCLVMAGSMRGI